MGYVMFLRKALLLFAVSAPFCIVLFFRRKYRICLFFYATWLCFVLFYPLFTLPTSKLVLTMYPLVGYNVSHTLQNVLLFMPFAFLLALVTNKMFMSFFMAVGFSAVAEGAQYFLPGRVCDINDFFANTAGAFLGVTCAVILWRKQNEIRNQRNMFTRDKL